MTIYKEGPHSALCDEEFYDAVETGLDKIDEDNQLRDRLKQKAVAIPQSPVGPAATHRLWPEVCLYSYKERVLLKIFLRKTFG